MLPTIEDEPAPGTAVNAVPSSLKTRRFAENAELLEKLKIFALNVVRN